MKILQRIYRSYKERRTQKTFETNREKWRKQQKNRLTNNNFTIISNNCAAGIIYHDLGMRFNSPTVNLFFKDMKDYITFIKDIKIYTSCNIVDVTSEENRNFPCGKLVPDNEEKKEIIICFQHYESFIEAKTAWIRRCCRINYDNIFFIYEFYNDSYEMKTLIDFDALAYEHKVALVHQPVDGIKCSVEINCYKNTTAKGIIFNYDGITGKRFLDEFDYVQFLNKEGKS